MRILAVSNCPVEDHLGSGYVIGGYARAMRARGHEVTVLDPRDFEWWPRWRIAKRLRLLLGYTRAATRAARSADWDVVELWGVESWWAMERLARRRSRPLLVARSNGLEPRYTEACARAGLEAKTGGRRIAARLADGWQRRDAAFRSADALTVVSEGERRYALAQAYQPEERTLLLENPLPDDWLGLSPPADRPPVIGYFGSWAPVKGEQLLRACLPRILRAVPRARIRLVGVGELRCDEFGGEFAERVEIVPFVKDKARLRALYQSTAIALFTSHYESFGLVAAEALACGCALVAAPAGLAESLLPDREAIVLTSRDADAWAQAVSALLGDDARRRRLATDGQVRVQAQRWPVAAARLEEFYGLCRARRAA